MVLEVMLVFRRKIPDRAYLFFRVGDRWRWWTIPLLYVRGKIPDKALCELEKISREDRRNVFAVISIPSVESADVALNVTVVLDEGRKIINQ